MENYNYRNCNDEVMVKLLGKLTNELPNLEVDFQEQLRVRKVIEEVLYNYEVTSRETALTTSDLEAKINYFLATKKLEGLSPRTLRNYEYILRKLQNTFYKPVGTITTADIKMLMYSEAEKKSPSSMNTFMTPIKLFFKWLQNEEFIIKNPCASIKPVKEPKRMRKPLTEEQVETLRDTMLTRREKAILEFFLSTGCRLSEVLNVKIKELDFNNKTLLVIGKGNKERKVYFTERCKRALLNYLKDRKDNCEYLFITDRKPCRKLSTRGMEVIVNKMQIKSGLDRNIHPHIFRHTFATHALRSGMKPEVIQQILGHEDVGITLKVYAKLAESDVEHSYRMLVS
ncbi:site-specific tyrosine recombinase/integron integrase [Clostridium tertium]|uniref:site-specific tyrosine recombinase/integron integrase n=1 Tax=Clostridium tertium TaxID=1559 RepID=UPI0024B3AA4E|nr:site-specific tyrosine recombinase/integron integrase [Clostridium tertium]MDI9215924.1 tyrosine-type recombinase/integrase [Clostridium tertium]